MRIRVLPMLVVLVLTGLFALINWNTFTTPTTLNLGFTTFTAPLGLVMLGVVALIGLMYVASVVYLQGSALLEARRMGKELEAQRALADKAEASRFTELRDFLNAEIQRLHRVNDELRLAMFARLDQVEQRSRAVMEESANSLSSYIGEMEDRLERRMPVLEGGSVRAGPGTPDYRAPR